MFATIFGLLESLFVAIRVLMNPSKREYQIEPKSMDDALYISIVFLLAGLSKGLVGMGLPLVAMALLVFRFDVSSAAGLMILPALLTNGVQAFVGKEFLLIIKRFWLLLVFSALTIILLSGVMSRLGNQASVVLGLLVVSYALYRLSGLKPQISPALEKWGNPIVGILAGISTALTGVLSIPLVPWLNALHLNRQTLVQTMGIAFLVAIISLTLNLGLSNGWRLVPPTHAVLSIGASFLGMRFGARLRNRLRENTFQTLFLYALVILGIALMAKPFVLES